MVEHGIRQNQDSWRTYQARRVDSFLYPLSFQGYLMEKCSQIDADRNRLMRQDWCGRATRGAKPLPPKVDGLLQDVRYRNITTRQERTHSVDEFVNQRKRSGRNETATNDVYEEVAW
jgi:hypothetical protein